MKKWTLFSLGVLVTGLLLPTATLGQSLYARVALFDVQPGMDAQFEAKVLDTGDDDLGNPGFVGERFLHNIDPLLHTYALYTRYTDPALMASSWSLRLPQLQPFLRRDPEVHTAVVTDTYTPAAVTQNPQGDEFGVGQIGQIAHIGLFIPFPQYRGEYDRILRFVKADTRQRNPLGFLGEDLLTEQTPASVEEQTPYSPRALELVPMSVNYGEFTSIENAENAYIQRASDRTDDPRLRYWYRAFFGSLQVPSRFYIFRVIGNIPGPSRVVGPPEITPLTIVGSSD